MCLYLAIVPAVGAATGQVLSTGSPVDHGHRLVSYNTSLVEVAVLIAGEDDEMFMTRSFNVTPKDNRIAHLTARSDKTLAYVTNNKRLFDVLYG